MMKGAESKPAGLSPRKTGNEMKNELTKIRIINDSFTSVTRESDPDDKWDRDDTCQSHNIKGFEIVDADRKYGYDFEVPFKIDPEKEYYLVAVYYDTGDSFGRDENVIDMIDLYDDINIATEVKRRILDNDNKGSYSVTILNPQGKEYQISTSWVGYFEHLNDVEIHRVKLKL